MVVIALEVALAFDDAVVEAVRLVQHDTRQLLISVSRQHRVGRKGESKRGKGGRKTVSVSGAK